MKSAALKNSVADFKCTGMVCHGSNTQARVHNPGMRIKSILDKIMKKIPFYIMIVVLLTGCGHGPSKGSAPEETQKLISQLRSTPPDQRGTFARSHPELAIAVSKSNDKKLIKEYGELAR